MLNEYLNQHVLELDRERREIAHSRPRYDRAARSGRSRMRGVVRAFALPAARATPGDGGRLPGVVIRSATSADVPMVARLAEASERRMPSGLVLLAEVETHVVAALPVGESYALTDLRRSTEDVVQLLELRSDQLGAARVA